MNASGSIELIDLTHVFVGRHGDGPTSVLDTVSLRIDDGGFTAVVGPSGCGKSTILRVLSGLLNPTGGQALIGGRSVVGRVGEVAMHPQRDLLLPWRRTMGNATLGAEVCGIDRTTARAQAEELLDRFGLTGFERAWPSQLSGGMRQRLALLRTFLVPRPVLLLDEPLGALDALTRRDLQGWLESVWLKDRRTTLLVTHDIDEALLLADQVIVLSPRPAQIRHIECATGDRPRKASSVTSADFVAAKKRILRALEADTGS